jgi:hypothetical protein
VAKKRRGKPMGALLVMESYKKAPPILDKSMSMAEEDKFYRDNILELVELETNYSGIDEVLKKDVKHSDDSNTEGHK